MVNRLSFCTIVAIYRVVLEDKWFIFMVDYRPQRSWAKVKFLQASVCPRGGGGGRGGVSASVHTGMPPPQSRPPGPGTPPPREQTPPQTRHTTTPLGADPHPPGSRPPPDQAHPPSPGTLPQEQTPPPPESILQHTVNERPVHILLECILVWHAIDGRCVQSSTDSFKAVRPQAPQPKGFCTPRACLNY